MRHYIGTRTEEGCTVEVIDPSHMAGGYELEPRFDLRNHSPTGFSWSFSGSGPAQLSLALLADALDSEERALANYQRFKQKVVARLPEDGWTMSQEDVRAAVADIEANRGRGR